MGAFEWANALAIRAAGVAPEWVQQTAYDSAPAADNASLGVSVDGALTTGIDVRCRDNPTTRRMVVSVTSFDGTGTYTATINGTPYPTSGAPYADAEALFDDVVTELAAEALVQAVRTGTGDDAILTVTSVAEADLSYGFTGDATDVFVVEADAAGADLKFYSIKRGTNPNPYWGAEVNGEYTLDAEGVKGPLLDTSQTARLYCYADASGVAGDGTEVVQTVVILFGPSFGLTSEV